MEVIVKDGFKFRRLNDELEFLIVESPITLIFYNYIEENKITYFECNYAKGFSESNLSFLNKVNAVHGLKVIGPFISLDGISKFGKKLNYLSIGGANSKDAIDFNELQELEVLYFDWKKSRDNFRLCKNLKKIAIGSIPVEDLTFLNNFPKLEYVRVGTPKLKSINGIQALKKIQTLSLHTCKNLENIDSIDNSTIEHFEMYYCNNVKDLAPLSKCYNIKTIDFECCKGFTDISPLSSLKNLRKLCLAECGDINSLLPLKDLPEFNTLYAPGAVKILDKKIEFLVKKGVEIALMKRREYDCQLY